MKKLIIHTDGGARGNPGPAGVGVVFYNEKKEIIKKLFKYLGIMTNNQAEYQAVIFALEKAWNFRPATIEVFLDSELVIKQLQGKYRVKNKNLHSLYNRVYYWIKKFKEVSFKYIPRQQNKLADKLVNQAIDRALRETEG